MFWQKCSLKTIKAIWLDLFWTCASSSAKLTHLNTEPAFCLAPDDRRIRDFDPAGESGQEQTGHLRELPLQLIPRPPCAAAQERAQHAAAGAAVAPVPLPEKTQHFSDVNWFPLRRHRAEALTSLRPTAPNFCASSAGYLATNPPSRLWDYETPEKATRSLLSFCNGISLFWKCCCFMLYRCRSLEVTWLGQLCTDWVQRPEPESKHTNKDTERPLLVASCFNMLPESKKTPFHF